MKREGSLTLVTVAFSWVLTLEAVVREAATGDWLRVPRGTSFASTSVFTSLFIPCCYSSFIVATSIISHSISSISPKATDLPRKMCNAIYVILIMARKVWCDFTSNRCYQKMGEAVDFSGKGIALGMCGNTLRSYAWVVWPCTTRWASLCFQLRGGWMKCPLLSFQVWKFQGTM